MPIETPEQAFALLHEQHAPVHLIRHAGLVLEVLNELLLSLRSSFGENLGLLDAELAKVGAILHDIGKLVHPDELHEKGHLHELAGQEMLLQMGLPVSVARFCVAHADWDVQERTLEELLVALADKLWKGKREAGLEERMIAEVTSRTKMERWGVLIALDQLFESLADDGDLRLMRSMQEGEFVRLDM